MQMKIFLIDKKKQASRARAARFARTRMDSGSCSESEDDYSGDSRSPSPPRRGNYDDRRRLPAQRAIPQQRQMNRNFYLNDCDDDESLFQLNDCEMEQNCDDMLQTIDLPIFLEEEREDKKKITTKKR